MPSALWCGLAVVAAAAAAAAAALVAAPQPPFPLPDRRYETDDAVVIEGLPPAGRRQARAAPTNQTAKREIRQFGGWPGVIPPGPCFSSKGVLGRCTSFRACYPYFKLPELNNWETWVLGLYDTCSYFSASGRQMFGVCCTNPTTVRPIQPPRPTPPSEPEEEEEPEEPEEEESVDLNPIPPNWPPPLPTHPPDHTIPPLPTHPPSPGWPGLPIESTTMPATTSTTKRPWPPYPWPPTTKPPTAQPWPPSVPTHPTRPPRPSKPTRPTTRPTRPTTTTTEPPEEYPGISTDAACGAKNGQEDQERIVGGQNADLGEWPWIVALFNGGRQFCGGSLVDKTHILTAAHCVAHMSSWDVARVTVRLGDHNIKTNSEVRHIEKKVKRVVRHRGFDSRTLYNDVAILTLDSAVPFSKQVHPICLPRGNSLYAGKTATVIGWGSLRESGPQPAVLQEVNIPVWTNSECKAKYGNAAPGGIVEHFLCAGQAGRDSCSGDSGGPLMVNSGGKWTQVGVVSWGIGCGKGQYPGVYTRVTHFMPWITKNLKN
ncbi:proclotting enzyme-like [Bacillus rossius redtenbacheri]|uniref:proclotting enzyme-like n=1 Tax=Bacillus rossius redtenbacheri TaxID=93214 RepID=UPI002FDDE42F